MARAPLLLALLAAACATPAPDLPARLAATPVAPAPAPDTPPAQHVAPTASATRIHDIQGAAQRSPLDGRAVSDVPGIVTAVVKPGFWMQDPQADDAPATSEALFVHLDPPQLDGAPLRPGDELLVAGTVSEYVPPSRKGQLPVTQIDAPVLRRVARDRPLPAPMRLGRGGRPIPSEILCDDARDGDACAGPFDPAQDGLDFWESLEGMLVEVADPVACSPTSSLGELWVLADGGADSTGRNARGGVSVRAADFNPERIQLVPLLAPVARVDVGTRLTQDGQPRVRGLLDYAFANWRLDVLAPVTAAGGGVAPERVQPAAAPDRELLVACLNLENLSPSSDAAKLAGLGRVIADNLAAPDIVAVEEVQDDSGPVKDGTVSAAGTLRALTDAIVAAGGPRYRCADIAPADGADGGQPGANIRCALLWREDRGVRLVERPGADAQAAARVVREGDAPALLPSPALVAPQDPCWTESRKPLAAEFRWGGGAALFVIANHWSSKGGDDPLFGARQPPQQESAARRVAQARAVRAFADELAAAGAQVLVLGDLNDFPFSDPLAALTAGGALVELTDRLPEVERYSYVYQGNSQQLDHILASPALAALCSEARPVHVNSEFAGQVSDHDPVIARFATGD